MTISLLFKKCFKFRILLFYLSISLSQQNIIFYDFSHRLVVNKKEKERMQPQNISNILPN